MATTNPFAERSSSISPTGLQLTIRFTASIPDLVVYLTDPSLTTVIALKQLIREKARPSAATTPISTIPTPTTLTATSVSTHRLRLIHSGKLLRDDDLLTEVLKIPALLPPPPRGPSSSSSSAAADPKGKGRALDDTPLPPPHVYINCSIGDELTRGDLALEARAATESATRAQTLRERRLQQAKTGGSGGSNNGAGTGHAASGHAPGSIGASGSSSSRGGAPPTTTVPAPQGFDRLLATGFTAAEVGQLRLQFLSIQRNIHTPDTMPSPTTLTRMEDAWIDDNAGGGPGNAGAGSGGGPGGGAGGFDFGDDAGGGALDDLLWGHVIGFMWPLGCLGWVMNEGGIWSQRRQVAVFTGFLMSLTFGMLRVIS